MKQNRIALCVMLIMLDVVISYASALAQTITAADLVSFNATPLQQPASTPVQGRNGLLNQTMPAGVGTEGYVISTSIQGAVTIASTLLNSSYGSQPWNYMLLGSDGNLYGMTRSGGVGGYGVLFKVTPGGGYTVLHSFNGGDGEGPLSLIEATDGSFYGTTLGGAFPSTVYEYTRKGVFSTLYTFDSLHGVFTNSLVQGSDGNLLVTSPEGGRSNNGTIVKMTRTGQLLDIYSFPGGVGGSHPQSMVQAADGNYYGVTYDGGQPTHFGYGTVFRYTPQGKVTILYAFSSSGVVGDGAYPFGLIAASDGYLYGNTIAGAANGLGAIFRISTSGAYNQLYSANLAIGEPFGVPMQHTNGLLYVSGTYGGPSNNGTYESGYGAIVSLNVGLLPFVKLVQNTRAVGQTAEILGQGLTGTTGVTFSGVAATSFQVVSDTYMTATVPTGAVSGPVVVTTPTGPLTSFPNFVLRK